MQPHTPHRCPTQARKPLISAPTPCGAEPDDPARHADLAPHRLGPTWLPAGASNRNYAPTPAHTPRSAFAHQPRRWCCPPSPPGPRRCAGRHRPPHKPWRPGPCCTNIQCGPLGGAGHRRRVPPGAARISRGFWPARLGVSPGGVAAAAPAAARGRKGIGEITSASPLHGRRGPISPPPSGEWLARPRDPGRSRARAPAPNWWS